MSVAMRGCNVHSPVLIKPELCHTNGSKCCVDTEGGGREPSGRKHDPHVCVGNGRASEGNESTGRGNNSLGLMGRWGSLNFSTGKEL